MGNKSNTKRPNRQPEGTQGKDGKIGGQFAVSLLAPPEKGLPGEAPGRDNLAAAADTATAAYYVAENRRLALLAAAVAPNATIIAHTLKDRFPEATHFDVLVNREDGDEWVDGISVLRADKDVLVQIGEIDETFFEEEHEDETQALIDCAKIIGADDLDSSDSLDSVEGFGNAKAINIEIATRTPLADAKQAAASLAVELSTAANRSFELYEVAAPAIAADMAATVRAEYPTATHFEPIIEIDGDSGEEYVSGYEVHRRTPGEKTYVTLASVPDWSADTAVSSVLVEHSKTLGKDWADQRALRSVTEVFTPDNDYAPQVKQISIGLALA